MNKIKLIFPLLSFLIMTACSNFGSSSLKSVIKKAKPATFIIYSYDDYGSPKGSGSGFFID